MWISALLLAPIMDALILLPSSSIPCNPSASLPFGHFINVLYKTHVSPHAHKPMSRVGQNHTYTVHIR